jgi:hypothetical protein
VPLLLEQDQVVKVITAQPLSLHLLLRQVEDMAVVFLALSLRADQADRVAVQATAAQVSVVLATLVDILQ